VDCFMVYFTDVSWSASPTWIVVDRSMVVNQKTNRLTELNRLWDTVKDGHDRST